MCGRFSLDRSAEILEARFKAKLRIEASVLPLYNIGPGMPAACIPMDDPGGISMYNWGLAEHSPDGKSRTLINARTESFCQKWPFKSLAKRNRCLVPASGYIEWKPIGQRKIPFLIRKKPGELFAFAGLFEEFSGIRRFTILTRPAGFISGAIHDRMPVILEPDMEEKWLAPDENPEKMGEYFLRQPEPDLETISISPSINKSFANNPDFLQPAPYSIPEQLKLF